MTVSEVTPREELIALRRALTRAKEVQILRRQIRRLTTDLNRLLDFSRIRSGRLELRQEDVDLVEVVSEVLQEMQPEFDISRCELRLCCAKPRNDHG